jgi:LysR family transcriptional regulator, hydrogen peroxide-inducible genes activator
MELHQLRYFVEVVQTGSFTQAAKRCHVTQPTLSHQIRKLEDQLGEPLLHRRKQGVLPTPLGQNFFTHAVSILGGVRAAQEEAASFTTELKGSLHLGIIPTIAPYLTPRLLKTFQVSSPHLAFRITEDTTDNLLAAMREGVIDVSILSLPIEGSEWLIDKLFRDEILVALPENHPLGKGGDVPVSRCKKEPLVLMKEAHCLRGQSLKICSRAGWEPDVFLTSSQIDTLLAMVEAGMGISFIPALARCSAQSRGVQLRSLAPEHYFRTIALVRARQSVPTRALLSFYQTCKEMLSEGISTPSQEFPVSPDA